MHTPLEQMCYQTAMSFKPFIDPKCTEHMEIVKDMAKSIRSVARNNNDLLKARVKQFLSSLDYNSFTDFQKQCAELLESELTTH